MSLSELAKLFKERELESSQVFELSPYAVFRLDGVGFSRLTKTLEQPFSDPFADAMDEAAVAASHSLANPLLTYVGSDEISIVVAPELWLLPHGARVEKLHTKAASMAAATFSLALARKTGVERVAAFDSRVLRLQSLDEVRDYVTSRRMDVRKNAISMAAHHLYGTAKLKGVSTRQRIDMLQGTKFEHIPDAVINGRIGFARCDQTELVIASKSITEAHMERLSALVASRKEEVERGPGNRSVHAMPSSASS